MMLWDDVTTAWGRLTIIQAETSWAICAEAEWPDGKQSSEALFNLTLAGVIDAISKRGPYVGQVVWRTPEEWKEGE